MESTEIVNADREERKFCGLSYARSLGFTDEQYQQALSRIRSASDENQLLVALIEVSNQQNQAQNIGCEQSIGQQKHQLCETPTTTEASSGFSSIASSASISTASSSNQSLECFDQSYNQQSQIDDSETTNSLRRIYIDGSNVARSHGKYGQFSWMGIKLCVDWFHRKGHKVKVFVPDDRCLLNASCDTSILDHLDSINALVRTPSGCNDDMFIIEAARQNAGVIVSNDLYRDERRRFGSSENLDRFIYLNRLPFVFVDDLFIPASDPRGRSGPRLEEFLRSQENQQHEYSLHLHKKSLHATRSLPADQLRRPVVANEYQNNQPPVDRLISIGRASWRCQATSRPSNGQQMPKELSQLSHQMSKTATNRIATSAANQQRKISLSRTRSHNI